MAYVNVYDYRKPGIFFNIMLGGRGCGKTFGALVGAVNDCRSGKGSFMYMRRTDKECQQASILNPFSPINAKMGWHVVPEAMGKTLTGFYDGILGEDGDWKAEGAPLGTMGALSTMGTTRGLGLDSAKITKVIYDEFIPEQHVRLLKCEGDAFFNAFESLNRNRELEGMDPLEVWLLANANKIDNPIFHSLKLVSVAEKMGNNGKKDYYDYDRGLALHFIADADFMEEKKKTALARLTEGSSFYDMAFNNLFAYDDFSGITYVDVRGMRPVFAIGPCHVWHSPSKGFYASYHEGSFAYRYRVESEADGMLARQRHGMSMRRAYADGTLRFESYELKALFLDFFKIK